MTDDDRREKDGRPARSKKARASYQRIVSETGRVRFKRQLTDPVTKKRTTVYGDTLPELMARVDEILRTRRNVRHGLVTAEEALAVVAKAAGKPDTLERTWAQWAKAAGHSARWKQKVASIWACHFAPKFAGATLHELTPDRMQDWTAWMRAKGLKAKTILNAFFELTACMRSAIVRGTIVDMPWRAWRPALTREEKRKTLGSDVAGFLSPEELARAMVAAGEIANRLWTSQGLLPDLPLRIGIMSMLGLRRGEAIALSWDAIRRFPDGRVVVAIDYAARESWRLNDAESAEVAGFRRPVTPPKAGRRRVIPLALDGQTIQLLAAQRSLLEQAGLHHPHGPVFPDAEGRYRGRDVVPPETFAAVAKRAGLYDAARKWTQHSARHSAARMAVRAGATLPNIQAMMGHAEAKTSSVYFDDFAIDQKPSAADSPAGLEAMRGPIVVAAEAATAKLLEGAPVLHGRDTPETVLARAVAEPDSGQSKSRDHHEKSLGRRVYDVSAHLDLATDRLPKEVRKIAHKVYRRAYNEARRAGMSKEECRKAGALAQRGLKAAYGSRRAVELNGGRRRLHAEAPPDPNAHDSGPDEKAAAVNEGLVGDDLPVKHAVKHSEDS